MRTLRAGLLLVAALLVGSGLAAQQFENVPAAKPAPAPAAPANLSIGVINIEAAVWGTQEGKKALEDMQAQFNPHTAELEKLRREVADLENQLRTQERTLSEEARMQLARQIELKRKIGTRKEEDFRDEAREAQADHFNRIGEKMNRVLDQFSREKSLSLILNFAPGGPVVKWAPAVDITQEIVRLYDQAHPVAKPAAAAPAAPAPASPPARTPPRPQ